MTEQSTHARKLQWKWLGISIAVYVVFYIIPILIASGWFSRGFVGNTVAVFRGIWFLAGIIIIAALVGYFSKGVALWEPVIAASLAPMTTLAIHIVRILNSSPGRSLSILHLTKELVLALALVTILSLVGAGLGGAFGEHRNSAGLKPPQST